MAEDKTENRVENAEELLAPNSPIEITGEEEGDALISDDYEEISKQKDHKRQERHKDFEAWVILVLFGLGVSVIVIFGGILVLHMVTPSDWIVHYLMEAQVQEIKQFFVGGGISAFLTSRYYTRARK